MGMPRPRPGMSRPRPGMFLENFGKGIGTELRDVVGHALEIFNVP